MLGGERQRRLTGLSTFCLIKWRVVHHLRHKVASSSLLRPLSPPSPPSPLPRVPSQGSYPKRWVCRLAAPSRRMGASEAGGATLPCPAGDHPRLNPHSARSGADLPQNWVLLPIPRRKCHSTTRNQPRATNHANPTTRTQPRTLNHAHPTTCNRARTPNHTQPFALNHAHPTTRN